MKRVIGWILLGCCLLGALGCGGGGATLPGTVTIDSKANLRKTKATKPPPPKVPK